MDPADPSFELDINGLPIVLDAGLGVSANQLIPYVPTSLAADAHPLYGDLFLRGTLDVAALSDDMAPITLGGDITLALDPDHLGLSKISQTLLTDLKASTPNQTATLNPLGSLQDNEKFLQDLKHIAIGANAEIDPSLSAGSGANLSMPASYGSLEWDGMHDMLYFGGKTANPLDGTFLSSFVSEDQANLTGTVNCNDGSFDIKGNASLGYSDYVFAGTTIEIKKGATGPVTLSLDANYAVNVSTSFTVAGTTISGSAVGNGKLHADLNSDGYTDILMTNQFTVSASGFGQTLSSTAPTTSISASGDQLSSYRSQLDGLRANAKQKAMVEALLLLYTFTS